MKNTITTVLSLCFLLLFIGNIDAQKQRSARTIISGQIVESANSAPIEFATIMLTDKATNEMITGSTSDHDGKFLLSTDKKDFNINISFIGFKEIVIDDYTINGNKIALGTVQLGMDGETLDEVTVRAERSQTEFKLDRRVFNVGQDLSRAGASALEVLDNVPSVAVSIEGDISLRGNGGVQILINGKPSVLSDGGNALGSITADMIKKVEVITNPSAKYDAEGSTGIINIVLKKEEKKGMNGSVSLNSGVPNNHSFGFSLNRRTEKFNLFTQLGAGYRTYPNKRESLNRNLATGSSVESIGTGDKNETFYNLILGTDYHINKNNVITLSGSYALEMESENSLVTFSQFAQENNVAALLNEWDREEITEAINPKFQYELQYKSDFEDHKDHALLFSATGRFFGKDQTSEFGNSVSTGSLNTTQQNVRTDFSDANFAYKLDYTKPITDEITIETGAQYLINDVGNDYGVEDFIDSEWILNDHLTNNFEFNQKVLGTYVTTAYEGDKWGLKAGVRLENTDLNTLLTNTGEEGDQNYNNLFPSLHTSYKVTDALSFQAGYSKRIYRPRMWHLNPFFNIRNNFNVYTGNPNLQPEFTDSYEVNGIFVSKKYSLNFGLYHRYTTDAVERITTFANNISTTLPLNIGTNKTYGYEMSGKYTVNKKITLTGDFNYNFEDRSIDFEEDIFDFSADRWTGRLRAKLKLPADIDMEVTGRHQSRVKNFQSVFSGYNTVDFGMRKKLMKGRTILNLSVRDLFASRIREGETNGDDFFAYTFSQRGRFVTFGISYGFGKGEAMEFAGNKGHRHH